MADEEDELLEALSGRNSNWPGARPKQAAFLTALVFHAGQHGKAAKSAKISRQTPRNWLKDDENYQLLYAEAMDQVAEVLEDEVIRRGKEGIDHGIYYQGEEIATEKEYSDQLLMFYLKAAKPEKYRDRAEVKGDVNVKHKFDGTMEELLALYHKLTMGRPAE